jgi:serine/threonine protein kinase
MQKTWNQYHLTRELAKKYSHSTYLASPINPQKGHGEPERQVVLTMFSASLFHSKRDCADLLRRAQRIKDCQHPHLQPILDMGIEQGQPFVVQEYLPDGSLRSHLKQIFPDRLPLQNALTIVSQVGQALVYAHERNIIHGNVKPENILFDANGQVVLTGFNLMDRKDAIIRDQAIEEHAFCYMAPEQFAGTYDVRGDQYALGCVAYELITGRVPFATQSLSSMMGQPTNILPAPFSQSVADLSPTLEVAVLKTLAQDPAERFFDFSLFLEVLGTVLSPPPAFPLLRSPSARRGRTISRPIPSVKAETVSSPIRERAAKQSVSQASEIVSPMGPDVTELASAHLGSDAIAPEQTETLSLTGSLESTLESRLFAASLSLDGGPLSDSDNASSYHPCQEQTYDRSSDLMVKTASQSEDLTEEIATSIAEQEPNNMWLNNLFEEEKVVSAPLVIGSASPNEQSDNLTSNMVSSLKSSARKDGVLTILTQHSKRRGLGLVLLSSVIVAICAGLWVSGAVPLDKNSLLAGLAFLRNDATGDNPTSDNTGANPRATPTVVMLNALKNHEESGPTASPTATGNLGPKAAIAGSKPNSEKTSSNQTGTNTSSNSNGASVTSSSTGSPSSTPTPSSTGGSSSTDSPSPTATPTPASSNPNPSGGYGFGGHGSGGFGGGFGCGMGR